MATAARPWVRERHDGCRICLTAGPGGPFVHHHVSPVPETHVDAEYQILLEEAQREVDAMLPGTPAIAPPVRWRWDRVRGLVRTSDS